MKDIFILGMGEIGSAVAAIEREAGNNVSYQDIANFDNLRDDKVYDIIHICIPFKELKQFMLDVSQALSEFTGRVAIIHSTVEVGTTRLVDCALSMPAVHSFCRGVHPDLVSGIRTFEKAIGGIDEEACDAAGLHFRSIGIDPRILSSPEASEAAKLLSTTYYGYAILFAKAAAEMCDGLELDFEEVYTWANESYNEGYKKLGKENVIRPVLTPPKGRIGGHCVVPNFKLLPPSPLKAFCLFSEAE